MRGYGAPTTEAATTSLTLPDWGWGDPTPSSWLSSTRNYGFGSVRDVYIDPFIISGESIGDDGGYRVRVRGIWPRLNASPRQRPKGFRVSLVHTNGTEYPCLSGRAGDGFDCSTDLRGLFLDAYSPLLDVGTYTLRVRYNNVTLDAGAISVLRRLRTREEYELRSALPNTFKAGARRASFDTLLNGSAPSARVEESSLLAHLLRSVAQSLQHYKGPLCTRITSSINLDDTVLPVESTLDFPESGEFYIEGVLFTYSSKTSTTFSGVSRPFGQVQVIPEGALVVGD